MQLQFHAGKFYFKELKILVKCLQIEESAVACIIEHLLVEISARPIGNELAQADKNIGQTI